MNCINRRHFMKHSAGALAAAWAASHALPGLAQETVALPKATTVRTLGKTGIETSVLGIGTGVKAWNKSSGLGRQGLSHTLRTLIHAYESGVRYFDMADMYGTHEYMREAMKQASMPREKLMLLSKTVSKDAEGVRKDLERFRQEVNTDYFDVVLLHCMTEGNWTETLKPCMDVLEEAKQQGVIRAHGVSCHNLDAMKTAAESPWVDVMLNRINPAGEKMDGTVEEVVAVLQRAHDNGKGMLGMKILGEGAIAERMNESIKFVLGLGCIDAMTIGFLKPEEVTDTVQRMETLA